MLAQSNTGIGTILGRLQNILLRYIPIISREHRSGNTERVDRCSQLDGTGGESTIIRRDYNSCNVRIIIFNTLPIFFVCR
jgi:hypothetical protein